MNCLSTEDMYDFIEGCIQDEQRKRIDRHIQSCETCADLLEELLETESELDTLFPKAHVDDLFTKQVMKQLPKKKGSSIPKRHWQVIFATVFVTAAVLFLVFSSLQQSPKMSTDTIGLSIKDVNVTDASIKVTLTMSNYNGDENFFYNTTDDLVALILPNGERQSISYWSEQLGEDILYEFPLFDVTYEQFKLQFNFDRINDGEGNWVFEVPIDRKKLLEETKNVSIDYSFEKDNIAVDFIRAQHGPFHSIIKFETTFTEEMATLIEQQVEKYTEGLPAAEKAAYGGYNGQLLYKVVNANKETLQRSNLEDTISIQNDRYAHTQTIGRYPRVQEGGYVDVIGAKYELPTNVRHVLTADQLPYTFKYDGTEYEVKLLSNQRLEISSDINATTISNWEVTVDYKTAWDTAKIRTDNEKKYTTITLDEDILLDSFILYGQTESKVIYFDEPIQVKIH